jgi:isoleucyl-tRNA synthetase
MADTPTSGESGAPKSEAALREEKTLAFWQEQGIFQKSLVKPAPNGDFIFYEGPPTANGRPGIHHLESRAFKDALPRYKTMRGFRVPRRAGWDTHGLPVELEVEKKLGFGGKKDIEEYGVAAFNTMCRESVFTYISDWQRFSDRVGYWVDQGKAYFTFDAPFMESVWNILKKVSDDGRLYKDYKVVPWCVRCGTALSSHELAQGYEDVKDLSVTAKFELVGEPGTYFLAWTTTPWTLPGNVGLAVGKNIDYVKVKATTEKGEEIYVLAKSRLESVMKDISYEVVGEIKGVELIGKAYVPLYPFAKDIAADSEKEKFETNAFKVYEADFVTTEDGTGIVHTAVMYGQEDFDLGTKVGLPKVHLVAPDGHFVPGTGWLEGRFVKDEEVAVDVIKDLAGRTPTSLLFSKEKHEHSYPFCWRCKTPLIYYARDSWYIRMQDLRETLVAENAKVNWEPAHIRDGRMGEWLRNAKDWAISRERYWGTPLPIWQNEDGTERVTIGSIDDLRSRTKKSGNTYTLMRHGQSEHNVTRIVTRDRDGSPLTDLGRSQITTSVKTLEGAGITKVFASPFLRTKETAELVMQGLNLPAEALQHDDRIIETDFGEYEGKTYEEFYEYLESHAYDAPFPGGESYQDAKNRFGAFLYELEDKYQNEHILIVTHGVGFAALTAAALGTDKVRSKELVKDAHADCGEVRALPFIPLPHNDDYELDLHRPYIDDVVLIGDSGVELRRVKDVIDVWFDSGAMPFAQDHYPFENKEWVDTKGFPADYISEAIDQTRGWFYTLLAVGTLMGRGAAYKNVICLGHLLDDKGLKMSKSKGNIVEPFAAIDQWGADTLRFWMYSVNAPGDAKSFDEKTVKESARTLSWLENSMKFYQLFATEDPANAHGEEQEIDRWMKARTAETVQLMTTHLDNYKLLEATRTLASLFEDLSQWYVRRVRDRAREGDAAALNTLRETLHISSQLLAPFAPFLAEEIFQVVRSEGDAESVHLTDWPTAGVIDSELITNMSRVRSLASEALMLRQKAGVKVRQPLASFIAPNIPTMPALIELLKEEINVKEIKEGDLSLDIELTDELIREGDVREFMRALADARKERDLEPKDLVSVTVSENATGTLNSAKLPGVRALMFAGTVDPMHTAELSFGTVTFHITNDAA